MLMGKESYLDINFISKKGLILKWNFQHFVHDAIYFHHLFVLMTPLDPHVSQLVSIYFKKIKQGDLIAFIYVDKKSRCRQLEWVEKSHIDPSPLLKLQEKMCDSRIESNLRLRLLQKATKASSLTQSNIIVNFILPESIKDEADQLRNQIQQYRQQGAFPYQCAIMAPGLRSQLSVSRGTHLLDTNEPQSMVDMFHKFVNSAALKFAKVGIECIGGQLGNAPRQNWVGVGFNKIQKVYYGPSVHYENDIISFCVLDPSIDSSFDFIITLELALFTEQHIRASKNVRICFGRHKNIAASVSVVGQQVPFSLGGMELINDPYQSLSLIKLTKMFTDGRQRDEEDIMHEIIMTEKLQQIKESELEYEYVDG